jgi:hypothetical protein
MIEKTEAWKANGYNTLFPTEEAAERWDTIYWIQLWFKNSGIELEEYEAVHIVDNYEGLLQVLKNHDKYMEGE